MTTEHLHFSTEMLRRLGEELSPHPDQGILELVRNSYDADAETCVITLSDTQKAGGTIRVVDDGNGMSADEIRNGWLILGKSNKSSQKRTSKQRLPIGNKGVGRLAALRLGRAATLTSRPKATPNIEHRLTLSWDDFDAAKVVDEVPIRLESVKRPAKEGHGTTIEISKVRSPLAEPEVRRLARALVLLADPFATLRGTSASFQPRLNAADFVELERLVSRGYLDESDYYLRAEVKSNGQASAFVKDYQGRELFRAKHKDLCDNRDRPVYECPSAVFEFWSFLLGGKRFSPREITLTEIREWLKEFGGVHLFHRGMRVSPYSDFDWLDINRSRVRNPEDRPGTNNSIGRFAVEDEAGRLLPKTDRIGFIEDNTFLELKRFATDALDWMADCRLKESEKRRKSTKEKTAKRVVVAKRKLRNVVAAMPTNVRDDVEAAIENYQKATDRQEGVLQGDLQLYRTLCTVGATAAAFAHQAKAPLMQIVSDARTLEGVLQKSRRGADNETLQEIASTIRSHADSLLSFSRITLDLLEHEKRRRGSVSLHKAIEDVLVLLTPYLELRKVTPKKELRAKDFTLLASRAALEAIITNLAINSMQAFLKATPRDRQLVFRTKDVGKRVELTVLDNGPGIAKLSTDEIWLPGKTTTEEGTGLGLTIVSDVVKELGGRARAIARGELGGAEFVIQLPVRKG